MCGQSGCSPSRAAHMGAELGRAGGRRRAAGWAAAPLLTRMWPARTRRGDDIWAGVRRYPWPPAWAQPGRQRRQRARRLQTVAPVFCFIVSTTFAAPSCGALGSSRGPITQRPAGRFAPRPRSHERLPQCAVQHRQRGEGLLAQAAGRVDPGGEEHSGGGEAGCWGPLQPFLGDERPAVVKQNAPDRGRRCSAAGRHHKPPPSRRSAMHPQACPSHPLTTRAVPLPTHPAVIQQGHPEAAAAQGGGLPPRGRGPRGQGTRGHRPAPRAVVQHRRGSRQDRAAGPGQPGCACYAGVGWWVEGEGMPAATVWQQPAGIQHAPAALPHAEADCLLCPGLLPQRSGSTAAPHQRGA